MRTCKSCGLTDGQPYGGTPACEGAWSGSQPRPIPEGCILRVAAPGPIDQRDRFGMCATPREIQALHTIANFPITNPQRNMDAAAMRQIARDVVGEDVALNNTADYKRHGD